MELLITNNMDAQKKFEGRIEINFVEGGYEEVLLQARNLIHSGSRLLSHPLMGSLKPNETPYRSILMDVKEGPLDYESLIMIEEALETYRKFASVVRPDRGVNTSEKMKADFRAIDLSLISSALDR